MPPGLALIQEPFCESWMSLENITTAALQIKVRNAGWYFTLLAEAHSCLGIDQTIESACNKAIALALNKVQQRFSVAELSLLKITKYPGFHIARVVLQTLQIEQHVSLRPVDEMPLQENLAS